MSKNPRAAGQSSSRTPKPPKPVRPRDVPPPSGPPPAVVFLVPLIAAAGLDKLVPWPIPGDHYVRLIGAALILIALPIMFWASGTQTKHRTTTKAWHEADALVTDGPFAFSRNPAYVGDVIWYLGGTLAIQSWWAAVLLPVVLVAFHFLVVKPEEDYLAARFGSAWTEYASRVRRWI